MILLETHSLEPITVFRPVSFAPVITEREGTATMVMGPESPEMAVGDWLQDDTEPGAGTVWRVRSLETDIKNGTRTATLEHIIAALRDVIMFGEIKPENMGGTSAGVSAETAARYVMGKQSDWTLYSFGYTMTAPFTFNGENLYDALEIISGAQESAGWTMDTQHYPFRLTIAPKSSAVVCEMRDGRNLNTIKRMIDRSQMFTRVYPIGKNNIHIDGDYVSQNESIYGRKDKIFTDSSIKDKGLLLKAAQDLLNNHCEPVVTVTVTGLELSHATGVPLDRLTVGTMCRIPLPEYGTVITERITRMAWRDKIRDEEDVTVTLANNRQDVARIIRDLNKGGGRGGRAQALDEEEDLAWFEDTNDHVAMVAKGIVGVDEETGEPNWVRLTELIVGENGLDSTVQGVKDDVVIAESHITQAEDRIMLSVADTATGLRSEISQTAGQITSQVTDTLNDFYTQIIQDASQIVIRTGDNTKTFHQDTPPTGTQQEPLVDGDVWFRGEGLYTWGDAADGTWLDDAPHTWGSGLTAEAWRYNGTTGEWVQVIDTYALLQDTRFKVTKESIDSVAGRVDVVDGQVQAHYSEMKQTADTIKASVKDEARGLEGRITQTAEYLRIDYNDKFNQAYSTIEQTAEQIRLNVRSGLDELESQITVESNRISLVVEGFGSNAKIKPASIVAAINNGASSIVISADHINLDGYVKATDITTTLISTLVADISQLHTKWIIADGVMIPYGSGATSLKNIFVDDITLSQSGNTYTLKYLKNGNETTVGTFSRATTLSGEWVSGAYTVTASPQGNTITTGGLSVASGQARRDGDLLYVPVTANAQPTGYEAWVNWKNLLSSHSNCVAGLSRYNTTGPVTLYVLSGGTYMSVGSHYWYHKNTNSSLTTYYS